MIEIGFEECKIEQVNSIGVIKNGGHLITVPASIGDGFNWPYMLFIPNNVNNESTLIVEGANTGKGSTQIQNIKLDKDKINEALANVKSDFIGNGNPIEAINERTTNYPLLYPLFPRFRYHGKSIYNHMLSSNSMFIDEAELKQLGLYRCDNQLVNMVKDACARLTRYGIQMDDKIIITGFSASSKFANRFTLLHPEIVKYTIAGGIGGIVTLPLREIAGEKLLWPLGIGNVPEINNEKLEIYKNVPQFYYMGLKDNNDSYEADENGENKFKGILEPEEAKQLYKLFGINMTGDRWLNTQKYVALLNSQGYNIRLESYEDGGHDPNIANDEIEEIFLSLEKSKEQQKS